VAGLAATFGSGAMTNSIGEIEHNDVLFVIGSNATEAHPIIGNKMKRAARLGAALIVADPRRTELAAKARLWLRLLPGTDNALINGMLNWIIANDLHDKEYLAARCEGFDDVWEVVKEWPPERAAQVTGVPAELIREAAELYATTERAGIYYTLGITEHTTGTANVMNLANLAMVTGHVGKEFSGVNPLRGQNNVQGACDMGALPNTFPGYPPVTDPAAIARFEAAWGVALSREVGLRIPEMLEQAVAGELKAMHIMGEDPVLTDADANHVRKAMAALDFLVVQDLFLTATAQYADVVLPAACYAEKDGTFTNTERRVQRVRKAVESPGECRDDWWIVNQISRRMGHDMGYTGPQQIFEEVRSLVPQYAGITYARIDRAGLQWPCPTEDHPGTRYLHKDGFARGKGLLRGIEYEAPAEMTSEEYPLLLSTGRMLYHYNVMTRHSDALETLRPNELMEINPEDAEQLGIVNGEVVEVSSRRGRITVEALVTDKVPPGTGFMTFHYEESPVNELTNSAYDPVTLTAEFKVCAVRVEKCADGAAAACVTEEVCGV